MSTKDVVVFAAASPVMLGAAGLFVHCIIEMFEDALWPRGLRWVVPAWQTLEEAVVRLAMRALWPEKLAVHKPRALHALERADESFRLWAGSSGTVPQWVPDNSGRGGHWIPARGTCACGYITECGIWRGDGHTTGRCPTGHEGSVRLWQD